MAVETHRGEVLIVEDTPASLKLLADLLSGAGYAVREAPDGELALWSAQSRPPQLILLDVRMPGIDGFEVCRRLKAAPALRDIPVIFLSAQSDTEDMLAGFRAGAIDFIGKPYQPEEVLARTAAHMALAHSQQALGEANLALTRTVEQLHDTREELRRAERLAALGAMVAGMAHELNTPIGNCVLAASALEQRTQAFSAAADGAVRRSDLNAFVADAQQASALLARNLAASARLIERFKQVATAQSGSLRRRCDLAELLAEVARSCAPQLQAAGGHLALAPAAAIVMESYPAALQQVLEELVANALQHGVAGRGDGVIALDAGSEDGMVRVRVSDNGAGIAAANLPRVFDPFFTTRLGQGGNGLGLYIVHNLVTNVLGGRIEAESRPGATCFTVTCPRSAPALADDFHATSADGS